MIRELGSARRLGGVGGIAEVVDGGVYVFDAVGEGGRSPGLPQEHTVAEEEDVVTRRGRSVWAMSRFFSLPGKPWTFFFSGCGPGPAAT